MRTVRIGEVRMERGRRTHQEHEKKMKGGEMRGDGEERDRCGKCEEEEEEEARWREINEAFKAHSSQRPYSGHVMINRPTFCQKYALCELVEWLFTVDGSVIC